MFQSARRRTGQEKMIISSCGQMDSNPQPLALQADALATKLRRHLYDS